MKRWILLPILLACAAICVAQPTQSWPRPTLQAVYSVADFVRSLGPSESLARYREFRGLVIERNTIRYYAPLLPCIFFDSASASIPERYLRLDDPSATDAFDDSTDVGLDPLQAGRRLLDIIGFRMRQHPDARIRLTGCTSSEKGSGETEALALERASTIRRYLVDVWSIDPKRIELTRVKTMERFTFEPRVPGAAAEMRRVDVSANDFEIHRPITMYSYRIYPQPEGAVFRMNNNRPDSLVLRREIVIERNGSAWHVIATPDVASTIVPPYEWGFGGNADSIPTDESPYVARLVLYDRNGLAHVSDDVTIPVMIVDRDPSDRYYRPEIFSSVPRRDSRALIYFDFADTTLGRDNQIVLRRYIMPMLEPGDNVAIEGSADLIEAATSDNATALATGRAAIVGKVIASICRQRDCTISSITARRDSSGAFYPEERMLNRMVRVGVSRVMP